MHKVSLLVLFSLASIVCVTGCFSSSTELPNTAKVNGTVTVAGSPARNLSITFESEGGQAAFGVTDDSGNYELTAAAGTKGAEIGVNTVRIETMLDAPAPAGYKDPIPAKYNKESTLKVTVEAGENTHNFDL
ncbi:MAG TPA: hypothetical protein DDZ51_25295 [Planctomycetaceae bacterium]|nr:hypothetical protein [Planctomycetaceae bacterium]